MKKRPQGALALEHVTAPRPGLVDCPWGWDSLHRSAKLGQACREYDCVREDSPLVPLRLKRLSRNITGKISSSDMPLPTPCLSCYRFLSFASGCKRKPQVLSPVSVRIHSCRSPVYTEVLPAAKAGRVRQDGRWACCWGVDLVPELEDPQAGFLPGKVRTGGF